MGGIDNAKAVHVWEWVYGKSLGFPLNFAMNLKLH